MSKFHYFSRWRDITNVVNHKRTFNIECTDPQNSVGFILPDADTGRYVWKLCVLQHTFFVKHEQNQNNSSSQVNLNIFQNLPENLNDSRDDLLATDQHQQLHQQQTNWHPSDSHLSLATTNTWTGNGETPILSSNMASRTSLQTSALDINNLTTSVPLDYSNRSSNWALNPMNSNPSLINRTQSSSCLDLSNNNNINSSNNNIGPDKEHLKALLPSYRPAPDYDTAMQQKYHSSSSELRINSNGAIMSSSQMLAAAAAAAAVTSAPAFETSHIDYNNITGSQPDVHRTTANNLESYYNSQQLQQPYPDVTQHHITNPTIGANYSDASDYGLSQRFKMMRLVKPPPPYPANRLSSTSTPDLALASHRALLGYRGSYVSGSSPDLVSTRPFLHQHQQQQQQQQQHHLMQIAPSHQILYPTARLRHSQGILPHGTYENLNFIEPTKTSLLSKHMQQKYDGNNIIYLVPRDQMILHDKQNVQYQSNGGNINANGNNNSNMMMNSSQHNINGSIEPIYENVPLPHPTTTSWKNENNSNEMRDRTSSVQSAPGVIRNHNHNNNNNNTESTPTITISSNHNTSNNNINNINNNNNTNTNNNNYHMLPDHKETYTKNPHQILSKTSSNPIINQNNYQTNNNNINNHTNSSQTLHYTPHLAKPINNNHSFKNDVNDIELNNKNHMNMSRVDSLNRSQSTNILDVTQSSSYTIDTNTTTDSGISSGSKEKKRKIWGILSRSKNSSDKQKSATLGREKDKNSKKSTDQLSKDGDSNLKHRWSTGLPRLQPLPANISKESLVSIFKCIWIW